MPRGTLRWDSVDLGVGKERGKRSTLATDWGSPQGSSQAIRVSVRASVPRYRGRGPIRASRVRCTLDRSTQRRDRGSWRRRRRRTCPDVVHHDQVSRRKKSEGDGYLSPRPLRMIRSRAVVTRWRPSRPNPIRGSPTGGARRGIRAGAHRPFLVVALSGTVIVGL
jgi:hypothetical protein